MHVPVLTNEVIRYLYPKPNQNFIDATIGGGGHSEILLTSIEPKGKIIGIDWNEDAIMKLEQKFKEEITEGRVKLVCDNFANLTVIYQRVGRPLLSGILFDFGLSRDLLESSGRGFSFTRDEPLIMTFHRQGTETGLTAEMFVNHASVEELAAIFKTYGEERYSMRIAREIVRTRERFPIKTSRGLAEAVSRAIPQRAHRIHPATRVFQAIRIVVNNELENINKTISQAIEIVEKDGRIVAISYHSLEDRIVKNVFRQAAKEGKAVLITKKPVLPSENEIKANPSSRSAKLRALKRT